MNEKVFRVFSLTYSLIKVQLDFFQLHIVFSPIICKSCGVAYMYT